MLFVVLSYEFSFLLLLLAWLKRSFDSLVSREEAPWRIVVGIDFGWDIWVDVNIPTGNAIGYFKLLVLLIAQCELFSHRGRIIRICWLTKTPSHGEFPRLCNANNAIERLFSLWTLAHGTCTSILFSLFINIKKTHHIILTLPLPSNKYLPPPSSPLYPNI